MLPEIPQIPLGNWLRWSPWCNDIIFVATSWKKNKNIVLNGHVLFLKKILQPWYISVSSYIEKLTIYRLTIARFRLAYPQIITLYTNHRDNMHALLTYNSFFQTLYVNRKKFVSKRNRLFFPFIHL